MTLFSEKLLEQIQGVKQKNVWIFRFQLLGIAFIILVLLVLSTILASLFILDIQQFWIISKLDSFSIGLLITQVLFEFLFLSLILIAFAFAFYRQTDWPLVRNKFILGLMMLCTVIFAGYGLTYSPFVSIFEDIKSGFTQVIPVRANQKNYLESILESRSIFVGKIVGINYESKTFTIKNSLKELTFNQGNLKLLPQLNELVAIKFSFKENKFECTKLIILKNQKYSEFFKSVLIR